MADGFVQELFDQAKIQNFIREECDRVKDLLIAKNTAYGSSFAKDCEIFSKTPARVGMLVRIEDKVKRIQNGNAPGEDTVLDLIGYLLLLRVLDRMKPGDAGNG